MGVSQHLGSLGASSYTAKLNSLVCLLLLALLSLLSVHLRDPAIATCHTSTCSARNISAAEHLGAKLI